MTREDDETQPAIMARRTSIAGEALRVRHALDRLKAQLRSIEIVLADAEQFKIPPGHEAAQALVTTAYEVVTGLTKIDVIIRND